MTRFLPILAAALLLSACGTPPALPTMATGDASALDGPARGGLSDEFAAHPSVQLAKPRAFALTSQASPFLQALSRTVDPMRAHVAEQLLADAVVSQGLARWDRLTTDGRFAVLQQAATVVCDAMGCELPRLNRQKRDPQQASLLAFYQPESEGFGQVVLYTDAIAQGGKYMAIATLVHELRHAAQYQLVQAEGLEGDSATLADAYDQAWETINTMGGQSDLAYGDYVHLNIEYDAFQTGNRVAALMANGGFDPAGLGFVDVQYQRGDAPVLDLLSLASRLVGTDLITAVNQAQYQSERGRGGRVQPQPQPQRHQGFTFNRRR